MKLPILVANFKMNLGLEETKVLLNDIFKGLKKIKNKLPVFDLVFCPNQLALDLTQQIINKNRFAGINIYLGAQNCFWEERGAYTGEISPLFLKQLGCQYVLVGHSERRQFLDESIKMIRQKLIAVLNNDLTPILCASETFADRQSSARDYKIIEQVGRLLEGVKLKVDQHLVITYDPMWVFGPGQALQSEEVEYVNRLIAQKVIDLYPLPIVRQNIRFIYGGSIDHTNIQKFLKQDTIDGVLVGAAALKAQEFIRLCQLMS